MADTSSKVRKGGLVDKRMQAMESSAGAAPPATVEVEPAPAAAAEPMGPEEKTIRRKYGMAVPGEEKPSTLSKIKKALGFASKP